MFCCEAQILIILNIMKLWGVKIYLDTSPFTTNIDQKVFFAPKWSIFIRKISYHFEIIKRSASQQNIDISLQVKPLL